MTWITRMVRRLRALVRRSAVEAEMADELRLHLEVEAREFERRGLSPEAALYFRSVLHGASLATSTSS